MELLLWLAEQQPDRAVEALSLAHALQAAHPHVSALTSLLARLSRNSIWQSVTSVQHSAGVRYLPINGWSPENPAQRIRKALLAPLRTDEHILSGLGRLVLSLHNTQPATLRISLSTEVLAHLTSEPLTVMYQIDDQPAHTIPLSPGEPYRLELKVPEGQHTLRVSLDNPLTNQFLRLQVAENGAATSPQALVRSIERAYHVATHQEPIRLLVLGPAWLRVDEWRDSRIRTRYRAVPPGWQPIRIAPDANQSERLVRIHQRVTAPTPPPLRARAVTVQPELLPEPLGQLAHHPTSPVVVLQDAYPLGQQEDGTWSFNSKWVSRTNVQEDTRLGENERFWELGATHRYFDADRRLYYETDLLGRARTDGGPTLGLKGHLVYRPRWRRLTLGLSGKAFVQLPAWDSDTAASATLQASAAQRFDIGTKVFHLPSLALFGRVLSMDNASENASGRVDQDVFTPYKADHRAGLTLAERITYRPWLDTLWSARLALTTNEDLDIFAPDRLTLRLQWKQLVGAFQINTAYRYAHFFADDDRDSAKDRHTLYLDTRWEHWRPAGQHRLEVRLRLRYDPVSSDLGVLLGVAWHMGSGRGYRDFRPGSIDFRDVRQHRIPQVFNNRLYDAEAS